MKKRFGEQSFLPLLFLLVGCDGKYSHTPSETLHAMAQKMPLAQRYDFYIEVYQNSSVPPSREIIDDIVMLGDPAWRYTIKRASTIDAYELERGLDVLADFDRHCTVEERKTLLGAIELFIYPHNTEGRGDMLTKLGYACNDPT